jgi:hypothetical protein
VTPTEPARDRADADEPATFLRAMEAPTEALTGLADALLAIGRDLHRPNAESVAMREIESDESLQGEQRRHGAADTHAAAALLNHSAADHGRAYGRLFTDLPAPIWAHRTMVRGCIEASARLRWVTEPGIAYDERSR